MKVLFITPKNSGASDIISSNTAEILEPTEQEYMSAVVKDECETMLLDMRFEEDSYFYKVLHEYNPDVVVITSRLWNLSVTKKYFEEIKKFNKDILTIQVCQFQSNSLPQMFLSNDMDIAIIDEGAFLFKKIISLYKVKKSIYGLEGTAYLLNGEFIINKRTTFEELDSLPFPDRELSAKYRLKYGWEWFRPAATIQTSKGCVNKCEFCMMWKTTNGKYFERGIENVVNELKTIKEKNIYVIDAEAFADSKRMHNLARLIKKENINKNYFVYARVDSIANNPQLIKEWADIGLKCIHVGFEYFKQEDLEKFNKNTTLHQQELAAKICDENNITISASFIVSNEYNKKDFKDLAKYCRKLGLIHVGFTALTPIPGTNIFEEYKDKLLTTNYDLFDLFHPVVKTNMDIKDFCKCYSDLFINSRTLWQNIKLITSQPIRDIPKTIKTYNTVVKSIRESYKYY